MLIDKLQIDADGLERSVNSVVDAVSQRLSLSDENEYRIRLVSNELLNNIVSYSGANAIELSADLEDGVLTLVIDDNGPGFCYDELMKRDVTRSGHLTRDRGRGIFLVRTVSDGFKYNEKGNSVEVVLDLNG